MRVLLTCHRFPPDGVGGVERYTQGLAAELARTGDKVTVITRCQTSPSQTVKLVRERLADGTRVHRVTGGGFFFDPWEDQLVRLEHCCRIALAEAAPDVLHVNHLIGLTPRVIEIAYRQLIPIVMSLHDFHMACPRVHLQTPDGELCDGPDGGRACAQTCFSHLGVEAQEIYRLRAEYFERLLALADRVVCPSRYVASYFERQGADASRIRIIPNGISLHSASKKRVSPRPRQPGDPLKLACLGAIVPHKGAHVLLEAVRLSQRPADVFLFGFNDPEYARQLRLQAETISGLNLRIYGQYCPSDLPRLLPDVDCVVAPSLVPETFSITTREAQSLGIPVLVARLGALPEAVIENHNGFCFDPRRPEELARLITTLAQDPDCLSRLREGACRTQLHSVCEHAALIQDVYHEAIEACVSRRSKSSDLEKLGVIHSMMLSARAA
jgi:glycosyltransferase involved in cell wall biosynthesis